MDRKSTKKLRLDRRLADRVNWISSAELEKELDALPDVSHKIAEPEEDTESSSVGEAAPESAAPAFGGLDTPQSSSSSGV
jgi:hypothetical protein